VSGARLVTPAAAETTPTHVRPRLVVAPGRADTLVVRQSRIVSESVALTSVSPDQLAQFVRGDGSLPEAFRAALQRAVDSRRALAETERQIYQLEAERQQIASDQHRIRENLRSVNPASAYGRRLQERLNTQEDRLDAVALQLDTLQQRAAAQRAALAVTVR
jgi:HPt (histidine-containing phosphotransfer) domain-containing protein